MMNRSPLQRKTALQSHTQLKSSTALRQSHRNSRPKSNEFSLTVRRLVHERSHGICERCRSQRFVHLHHAVFRSQQGSNELHNAIGLCLACHHAAHSNREVREWCVKEAHRLAS